MGNTRSRLKTKILHSGSCAIASLLLGSVLFVPSAKAVRFSDIPQHWAETCIDSGASQGLLQGYHEGRFVPEGTLTRAEFAALMIKAFPTAQPIRTAPNFRDVPTNHWAKGAIAQAYRFGFLSGYPDSSFRPNQPINKVQALTILANAQSLVPPTEPDAILQAAYADAAAVPAYGREAIAAATVKGLVINYPQVSQLQPNRNLGRAEAAALLC